MFQRVSRWPISFDQIRHALLSKAKLALPSGETSELFIVVQVLFFSQSVKAKQ
jgi:hypothetical protein